MSLFQPHHHPATYQVTIQATTVRGMDWKVVATGRWTAGRGPLLAEHTVSADVLENLFHLTPSATDQLLRNQIQSGDTLYAVVFRKLSRP
jgi:hypothetical protein